MIRCDCLLNDTPHQKTSGYYPILSPYFGWPCSQVFLIFLALRFMKHILAPLFQSPSQTVFDTGFGGSNTFTWYLKHIRETYSHIFPATSSKITKKTPWTSSQPPFTQWIGLRKKCRNTPIYWENPWFSIDLPWTNPLIHPFPRQFPLRPGGPVLPKQPPSPSGAPASAGSSSIGHLDLEAQGVPH